MARLCNHRALYLFHSLHIFPTIFLLPFRFFASYERNVFLIYSLMKNLMLFVFCAVLCVALTSCEKEKDNDGKYNPKKKIQKVYYDSSGEKVLDQVWNWDGKLLSSVDYYYRGNVNASDQYLYDNNNRITKIICDNEYLDFAYENDRIKTITSFWADESEESYDMFYENNKLSKIEWKAYYIDKGIHDKNLNPLAGLIPQECGNLEKAIRKMHTQQKGEDKIIIKLTWDGNNVSHILMYLEDDPDFTIEASFTYDDKINPMRDWIPFWFDEVIGIYDESYYTYSSYGNVTSAVYVYKENGFEAERYVTSFSYEYDGKYPVKVMATEDGDTYFTRYYEY